MTLNTWKDTEDSEHSICPHFRYDFKIWPQNTDINVNFMILCTSQSDVTPY